MKDRQRLKDILDAIQAIEEYAVASFDELAVDGRT